MSALAPQHECDTIDRLRFRYNNRFNPDIFGTVIRWLPTPNMESKHFCGNVPSAGCKNLLRFCRQNVLMSENDPDRERAAECLLRARRASTSAEKMIWFELAQCWILMSFARSNVADQSPENPEQAPRAFTARAAS
jgi:hypothetical protein